MQCCGSGSVFRSFVDPDSYLIRIQELCGSRATNANIAKNRNKKCKI